MTNYENGLVTFVDILGFKDLVDNRLKEKPDKILEIVDTFNTQVKKFSIIKAYEKPDNLIIRHFSDSIVRVLILEESDLKEQNLMRYLFWELVNIALSQSELLKKGILCRGGISLGKFFVNDDHIFGSAINKAYNIESTLALYPIIAIDDDIIKYVYKQYNNQSTRSIADIIPLLLTNYQHNCFYLNFILLSQRLWGYDGKEKDSTIQELKRNKDTILFELKKNINKPQVLSKIMWLKEYYNHTILSHAEPKEIIDKFLILS